jgi:hypothetical protein
VTGSLNSWGKFFTSIESDECVWSATHFNESCCDTMEKCFSPQFLDGETRLPLEPEEVPRALREATYPRKAPSGANTAASLPSFLPFPGFPHICPEPALPNHRFTNKTQKKSRFLLSTGPYSALNASAGPPGGCRDTPGPASPTVYCIKSQSPTWVAYRWYRFVDQPGLQQALNSQAERDFIQNRVTLLHKMLGEVRKGTPFWSHYYTKTDICLPRQARDKHRKS